MNEENKGNRQQKRTVTALLILKMGKATLKTFKLFSDDLIVTIGRHENNTIRLKDDKNMISRSHAAILRKITEENISPKNGEKSKEDPQFFIRDLVSSYGNRVNGWYVRKKLLREGDLIRIDDYIIEFTRRDLTRKPRGRTIDQDDEFRAFKTPTPQRSWALLQPAKAAILPMRKRRCFLALPIEVWGSTHLKAPKNSLSCCSKP